MSELNHEQLEFFNHHKIPLSQVFDATGLRHKQYKTIMHQLGMIVAFGVTPCKKAGHTLRDKNGHCIQCGTHNLSFIRRFDKAGTVYVATSNNGGLTKIGTTQDIEERVNSLNAHEYGGCSDWEIQFSIYCEKAGRVELLAQQELSEYRISGSYEKQGKFVDCHELFDCFVNEAKHQIKLAIIFSKLY